MFVFKKMDKVRWSVRGIVHIGHVIEVVPPGTPCKGYRDGYGIPGLRNHTSYVVRCGNKDYYPRVAALNPL